VVFQLNAAQHFLSMQSSSVSFCVLFLPLDIDLLPRNLQYADEMIIVKVAFTFPPKRLRF
jgi:hypothetical protein